MVRRDMVSERYKLGGMAGTDEGSPPWSIIDTDTGKVAEWVVGRSNAEKRVAELNAQTRQ